jgi:penicillin-binding protein 2
MSEFLSFHKRRRKKSKEIEPHEVFLDKLAQEKEEEFGFSQKRLEVSLPITALKFFAILAFFSFFVLAGRSFQLQVVRGEFFSSLAERNISSISSTQLLRGIIYDRNRNQLVYNAPQQDLYFQGRGVSSVDSETIGQVAKIIGKEPRELLEKIKESDSNLTLIKRNLDHNTLVQIESKINKLQGFLILQTAGRSYVEGSAFSHILGYIGKIDQKTISDNPGKYTIHDYIGKSGIEKYYENYLTRSGEKIAIKRDAAGNIIEKEIIEEMSQGKNVILTIDKDLQLIVQEKTIEKLEEQGLRKAAVVAMNPQTGEILSLASFPSYDNNLFRKDATQEDFLQLFEDLDAVFLNRAISAEYLAGSIIKTLIGAAALEEGIISPQKEIYSPGYISIPNPWNPAQPTIFRDFQAHGWRNMREALAVSSNVYFYAVGGGYEDQRGLGAEKIKEYLELFGWGEKTGIDLSAETKGFIPDMQWKREKIGDMWRIGDTYNLSIGQGYLGVTPLQVTVSFSSLVNGGKVLRPYVVKNVIDDDGKELMRRRQEVKRENFISPENLAVIKEGMRLATIIGTATHLRVLPVESGAKTGTAQTSKPGFYHSWISVFAPYDNPEIVLTVIVEDVEGVVPVAAHIARDILVDYFNLY